MRLAWRLMVDDDPGGGVWNMAVDHAVHSACADGLVPPTLRVYTWRRPTISLGRFQDASDVDLALCAERGVDVVRRFTGGRGVLHDDEVTYSVVASVQDGVPRGVAASYRYLCAGLEEAYRILGVEAKLTRRARGDGGSAACYLHATPADLSAGSRKLSGSAQVWSGATVLQHGSFTITRNLELEAAIFRMDDMARRSLTVTTATLEDCLGSAPSRDVIVDAIRQGFQRGMGITLVADRLTQTEIDYARECAAESEREGTGRSEHPNGTSGLSEG